MASTSEKRESAVAAGSLLQPPRIRVMRALKAWISDGSLITGDRVPAERTLALQFDVSRDTIRAAMEMLEEEQVIRRLDSGARVVGAPARVGATTTSDTVVIVTTLTPADLPGKASGWELWLGSGATSAIHAAGLSVLLLHPDHLIAERLVSDRPRGVILLHQTARGEAGAAVLSALSAANIPTVIFGDPDEFPAYDTVYSDHEQGSFELTSWLISQGRKRILRFWDTREDQYPAWLKRRDAGYMRAMRSHGLEPLPAISWPVGSGVWPNCAANYAMNARYAAGFLVEYMVGDGVVDAVMATSDGQADSVSGACQLFGRRLGEDVLVAGYDNYWQDCPSRPWAPAPPAATMDKMNEQIGHELVQVLMDRSRGRLPAERVHRLIHPKLVVPGAD